MLTLGLQEETYIPKKFDGSKELAALKAFQQGDVDYIEHSGGPDNCIKKYVNCMRGCSGSINKCREQCNDLYEKCKSSIVQQNSPSSYAN